ncbi:hypothetical protein [Devosia sp.]|uniref:hypothetical protein n=1 Tax=Devosia sp. TaxID=1871048 RepID=UPI001AD0373D|nr:hypothetical protein [Devosia sp.]MBN9335620.1 hypothetical protein [Devosia sp.]
MKLYDSATMARFAKGEEDFIDAIIFIFDSGPVCVFVGRGSFTWDDEEIGLQTFYGLAPLLSIEVPSQSLSNESLPITVRLAETYMPEGSDTPVNVFDDGVRQTIDEEPWQGREAILSRFWLDENGVPIYRERIGRRVIDDMPTEEDEAGNPIRTAVLEREDIIQRNVEAKTVNADLQRLLDPTDLACEHIRTTARQQISFGALPEQSAGT